MSAHVERTAVIESDENRITVICSDGVSGGGLYPSPDLFPSPDLYPARASPPTDRTKKIEEENRNVIVICKPQYL